MTAVPLPSTMKLKLIARVAPKLVLVKAVFGHSAADIRICIGLSAPYTSTNPGKKSLREVVVRLKADVGGICSSVRRTYRSSDSYKVRKSDSTE